jgi:hypothetical protein
VVWWFNPLYWYVRHQLRENAELACDAWVVGLLPAGRRAYAQALIEVTEFVSLAPAAMPAVAMGNVARRTLERRLTMIMRDRSSYRVPLLGTALIGLSLLAVLPGWSGGQDNSALPASESLPPLPAVAIPGTNSDLVTELAPGTAIPNATSDAGLPPDALANNPAGAPAVASSEGANPEARIRQLEAQLNQLQTAVQALRGGAPSTSQQDMAQARVSANNGSSARLANDYQAHRGAFLAYSNRLSGRRGGYTVETLTRARYKLSQETAEALATFMGQHVKRDVQVQVAGETLTVIASQEDQAKIGAFIELLDNEQGAAGPGPQPGLPGMQPGANPDLKPAETPRNQPGAQLLPARR